ncbi:polysaccharide biosynthesis/export family protein [Derxia gummosa]|uniref:Polysaccharide biosynthesis/export family protein n=1 Tax=Derxia gummosa DSM 723 TaxID=1121388 RepID=A0A8B6X5R2_9BURK|nr:polysaccharide biosynthesis/export family protein [Derxia gummosa]
MRRLFSRGLLVALLAAVAPAQAQIGALLPGFGPQPSAGTAQATPQAGGTQSAAQPPAQTGVGTAPAAAGSFPAATPVQPGVQPVPFNPAPAGYDYSANLASDVFGANLFTGSFARLSASNFNADYAIAVGDQVQVRLWGAFEFDSRIAVDPQGNIFLPHVGPVRVLGVRNQDLQRVVEQAVARVFRANVSSYASLAVAQPVRVFVGGYVNRPGLYSGTSLDSALNYLDQAGGIALDRGSFLDVQIKRGAAVRARLDLYDFLLDGRMQPVQLADGDVIFVGPRRSTIKALGLAENTNRFEFAGRSLPMAELVRLARPFASATHVRVTRNTGTVLKTEYYALDQSAEVSLGNGDAVEFTADKKPGIITVRVQGEHDSLQEYVLPYGSRLADVMKQIRFSERSDRDNIQLFRASVKDRQRQMLATALHGLEASVLTARSGTSDEATLRKEEADLVLQWVDRARKVDPSGQVLIAESAQRDELLLENGDIINVPARDGLVLVSGDVLFPNAIAYDRKLGVRDYIAGAGGFVQNAGTSRVVIAHVNGSFNDLGSADDWGFKGGADSVRPGDQILVLPKIDVKSRQVLKDMTQILYQIAIAARVVLSF